MRRGNPHPARPVDNTFRAFMWMVLSGLAFTGMSVFVKRLSSHLDQSVLVFFRSAINALVAMALVIQGGRTPWPKRLKRVLGLRGLAGFLSLVCLFFGLSRLPLPIASLLSWSAPIFVILFSFLFLQERPPAGFLPKVALVFGGLLLVLLPGSGLVGGEVDSPLSWVAVTVGLLGAVFGGAAFVAVRAATAELTTEVIVLWFTSIASLLSLPWFLFKFTPITRADGLELMLLGLFASLGQIAMTQGYRHASAGVVSSMSLMNAVFFAVTGWLVFGETLGPLQCLGMAIMAYGVVCLGTGSGRKSKPNSSPLV
jgi:drug/metabolite transporter (DMT)-like permease